MIKQEKKSIDFKMAEELLPQLLLQSRWTSSRSQRKAIEDCITLCEEILQAKPIFELQANESLKSGLPKSVQTYLPQNSPENSQVNAYLLELRVRYAQFKQAQVPNEIVNWVGNWQKNIDAIAGAFVLDRIKQFRNFVNAKKENWASTLKRKSFTRFGIFDRIRTLSLAKKSEKLTGEIEQLKREKELRQTSLSQDLEKISQSAGFVAFLFKIPFFQGGQESQKLQRQLLLTFEKELGNVVQKDIQILQESISELRSDLEFRQQEATQMKTSLRAFENELSKRSNRQIDSGNQRLIWDATESQVRSAYEPLSPRTQELERTLQNLEKTYKYTYSEIVRLAGVLNEYYQPARDIIAAAATSQNSEQASR